MCHMVPNCQIFVSLIFSIYSSHNNPKYKVNYLLSQYWLLHIKSNMYKQTTTLASINYIHINGYFHAFDHMISSRIANLALFYYWQIFDLQANSKFTLISPSPSVVLTPDYLSIITHILSINPLLQMCHSLPIFFCYIWKFPYIALSCFISHQTAKKNIYTSVMIHVVWVSDLIEWPRCGCVLEILT